MTSEIKANIAITDGGGRGAVAVEQYLKSPHVDKILVFPGNAMMAEGREDRVKIFPQIKTSDVHQIMKACVEYRVTHVDPIQDNAVKAGITDLANLYRIKSMGPTSAAGRIEWDKEYAREVARQAGILQPEYVAFSTVEDAEMWLESQPEIKRFVKAVGLAEGKGSIGAETKQDVLDAIKRLKSEYPVASRRFLIETALVGEEVSAFAISDGIRTKIVGYAQDHKREFKGDLGENTGGMGAVSNPIVMSDQWLQRDISYDIHHMIEIQERVGNAYKGWVFHGAMLVEKEWISSAGRGMRLFPHLIEWNARPGDPEHQVIAPGLKVDYFEMGEAIADGNISRLDIQNDGKVRVVVAIVSRGYPRNYDAVKKREIRSIKELRRLDGVNIYGAGIAIEDGKHFIDGGRVYYVSAEGADVLEASEKLNPALEIVEKMDGENLRFRKDIGWRDVERLRKNSV